jgi:hypothetical protein
LDKRQIPKKLLKAWLNAEMYEYWKNHIKRYPDLPVDMSELIKDVNRWLEN